MSLIDPVCIKQRKVVLDRGKAVLFLSLLRPGGYSAHKTIGIGRIVYPVIVGIQALAYQLFIPINSVPYQRLEFLP